MARRQLLQAGLGRRAIEERLASGLLVVVHRGVYCLGAPTLRSHLRAALLAAGEGAVLSHMSAAWLHGLLEKPPGSIHVTTVRRVRRRRGVISHCIRALPAAEITTRNGFPCTTVARTLVDLAATEPRRRVEQVLDQAERLEVWNEAEVRRTRPGSSRLEAILAEFDTEHDHHAQPARGGVPRPVQVLNARLVLPSGRVIFPDALWRSEKVAIELDGRAAHLRRRTFESDRARDVELTVAGYLTARFTWLQITRRPAWVAAPGWRPARTQPPATAGRIVTSSPSSTGVSR